MKGKGKNVTKTFLIILYRKLLLSIFRESEIFVYFIVCSTYTYIFPFEFNFIYSHVFILFPLAFSVSERNWGWIYLLFEGWGVKRLTSLSRWKFQSPDTQFLNHQLDILFHFHSMQLIVQSSSSANNPRSCAWNNYVTLNKHEWMLSNVVSLLMRALSSTPSHRDNYNETHNSGNGNQ